MKCHRIGKHCHIFCGKFTCDIFPVTPTIAADQHAMTDVPVIMVYAWRPRQFKFCRHLEELTFSKYKVVQKLIDLGLWGNIKAGLTDDQKDFLYLAQDFKLSDPNFYAIYSQLYPNIPNIDALLRECVLE